MPNIGPKLKCIVLNKDFRWSKAVAAYSFGVMSCAIDLYVTPTTATAESRDTIFFIIIYRNH